MSRNNSQEYLHKMEQQRQHFGLRKLSVGVASVLLGTTFIIGGSTVAHASDGDPAETGNVTTMTSDSAQEGQTTSESTDKGQVVAKVDAASISDVAKSTDVNSDKLLTTQLISAEKETESSTSQTSSNQITQPQQPVTASIDQLKGTQNDSDKIIHVTANFVNHVNNKTVKKVELTAKQGETLYDALGADVYTYILETDYPSYVLLPSDEYKAKVNYHGFTGTNYFNDPKLAEDFAKWQQEYKEGKHPLMGYLPYENDPENLAHQDLFSGRKILKDGETVNIPVETPGRSPRVNVYVLLSSTPAQRVVNYNKYLGEGKKEQLAYHVENGQIYTPLDNSGTIPAGVFESYDNHGQIPNEFSSRSIDKSGLVSQTGMIKDNQFTAAVVYPEETDAKRQAAEKAGKIAGKWTTLDSLIPEIPFVDVNDDNSYETNSDNVVKKGDTPGQPAPENIMYYANRQFNVVFNDITFGDDATHMIDLKNYDYTDKNQMTMAANSKTNPHNGETNSNYHEYKLDADDYQAKLKALHDAGYVIVSSNVNLNGQTYDVNQFNAEHLYNADGTIKPETYVVKVLRGVKKVTPAASATRLVNYKANSKDGQTLKDPVTQQASFVGVGDYYVDTINGGNDLVHVKSVHDIYDNQNALVVDSSQQDPVNVTWSIDQSKTKHDVNDQFNFEKPTGEEAPEQIGDWLHKPSLDINNQADTYTPVNGEAKELDPVYLIYKQKQSASGSELSYDKPQGKIGVSGPELNFDKPEFNIVAQPTSQPSGQPTTQPSEQPTAQPSEPVVNPITPTQSTELVDSTETVIPTEKVISNAEGRSQATKQPAPQLPQTGNEHGRGLIALGFAGLLSALGLGKTKRKRG